MIGPGIEHLWPNAMRFAHPKADVSTDWIVHEAFGVLDTTLDSLSHLARMAHEGLHLLACVNTCSTSC